ncbi:tRNA 2-selenouridine(34) synthase MnmH [Shewanella sp. NIFS-20-20]|uniref:tRNA 2-selenouridine(34) synthase MnmH n=1 Tax=Shewanella sp. NIFS-20-20 TaxID=2853806 RepID=UPI001C47AB52|nr:tRNA 2-selenouridine(34) synthase MnmH [Shewanella sp. NIFS-20-20]MBV7316708.1 tRNA 2-selenouridine(34) synthase MnmH [Shewanella sp. NIFS-20-20]
MTMEPIPACEFNRIFLSGHPMMDTRAPIEFAKGAFPTSVNLPLMTDSERQKVGTCYKEQGQEAALALGHQLVRGKTKQQRIDAWLGFISAHPPAYLYCFRGGLRSRISQQWLADAGVNIAYIEGGYKAMRQHLINVIDHAPTLGMMQIISGSTGCGKTDFLLERAEAVDLEGIANHRGSSFGRKHEPQPSQINFENQLAVALLHHQQQQHARLLLEDESFLIGRSALPVNFYTKMQQADILVLEEPLEQRLNRLLDEYVHKMYSGYVERLGIDTGLQAFSDYLHQSISGIKKRLGGKLHDEFQQLIDQAIKQQVSQNDTAGHLRWIALLLEKYYDPMYSYQLENKTPRIKFKGSHADMHQWLDQPAN